MCLLYRVNTIQGFTVPKMYSHVTYLYMYTSWFILLCALDTWVSEHFNQTLSQYLVKVCDDDQRNWDEKTNVVLIGYGASRPSFYKTIALHFVVSTAYEASN